MDCRHNVYKKQGQGPSADHRPWWRVAWNPLLGAQPFPADAWHGHGIHLWIPAVTSKELQMQDRDVLGAHQLSADCVPTTGGTLRGRSNDSATPPQTYEKCLRGLGVWVITLDPLGKRWVQTESQWRALASVADLYQVRGTHGGHNPWLQDRIDPQAYQIFFRSTMGPGTAGCSWSHLRAWSALVASGHDWGLICEDDVAFDPEDLISVLQDLQVQPGAWDGVIFQVNHGKMRLPIAPLSVSSSASERRWLCAYAGLVTGGGCYLLTKDAARVLLSRALPLRMPIDHYYTRGWDFGLRILGIEPRIVRPVPGDASDIATIGRQDRLPKHWRVSLVRMCALALRAMQALIWSVRVWWQRNSLPPSGCGSKRRRDGV